MSGRNGNQWLPRCWSIRINKSLIGSHRHANAIPRNCKHSRTPITLRCAHSRVLSIRVAIDEVRMWG
jgi:hypothetical protein